MVTAEFKEGTSAVIVYGLKQYDRGQVLEILGLSLPDLCQIHIAALDDGEDSALICLGQSQEGKTSVKIPDSLLEKGADLAAYIYEGAETTRTVFLPVQERERPDVSLPDTPSDLLEFLLNRINKKADDLSLEDGYLQLLSGKDKIGQRVRLPTGSGGAGREIELKNDGEAIRWRYTDSNDWLTLVLLSDLRGKDGKTPEFELRENGHLYALYEE